MLDSLFSDIVNILIVDDEPFNIIAFKLILSKYNHFKFEDAYNG